MEKKIYIIHENDEWTSHLVNRLEELNLPYECWHLDKGTVNLEEEPPAGVFYNRISPSSHTRGHRYAPELTGAVLDWLESYHRIIVNGSRSLMLELSKVRQYMILKEFGIQVPKTIAAVGKKEIVEAAKALCVTPFISKHNRAGKGLGVQKFETISAIEKYVNSDAFEESVDGITLVQAFIKSPESFITRMEFVGGKYLYSVRVDSSDGFELCPADSCQIGNAFCPVGENPKMKFQIVDNPHIELIEKCKVFLAKSGIDVAGIEFIEDESGELYVYDVNVNTNYNSNAENLAGKFGMLEIAKYLGGLL
jgi:glutathione synthase/RimK-type ligase-like ATP-grasp enzyme